MRYHRLFTLILFLAFALQAKATVFTVTSNADSGPGTLREALTLAAANGSATQDFIYFNLPDVSEAGRTIILLSELPYTSSNLVIDGSTQPGAKIKMSDAKITLIPDYDSYVVPDHESAALTVRGVNHVEIYGFFITGFRNLKNNFPSAAIPNDAIVMVNSDHIVVGAPGKGNIFARNDQSIYAHTTNYTTNDLPHDVLIQSNYFGYVNDDGTYEIEGMNFYGDNLTFGGDSPAMGNHILGYLNFGGNNDIIKNNAWGLDINGNPITENNASGTFLPKLNQLSASNNLLVADNTFAFIYMGFNSATNLTVINNKALTTHGGGIDLNNCENATIGTDDIALLNNFLNANVTAINSKNIEVRKNSFSCSDYPYRILTPLSTIPQITVLVNNNTEFSGTAAPNADVYIYNDNTSCDICNPVEYFATAKAAADGTWKITGDFSAKKLLANATLNNNSSEYTIPVIGQSEITILHPSCGLNNGSIKLSPAKHVILVEWYNNNNEKIGEGLEINGLAPGRYYAKGFNGKCFSVSTDIYLINRQTKIQDGNLQVVQPSCGNTGSITGLFATAAHDITYVWKDQNNQFVTNNVNLTNAAAGIYTLTAQDNVNGCSDTYPPIALTANSGPAINESAAVITPTKCYASTGAITGITATGAGTLKYSWRNESNLEVGTDADLTNQPPGKYMLMVTDESNCGPVFSSQHEIPGSNDIAIDITTRVVADETCNNYDGAIKNVTVTPNITGAIYTWYNEKNEIKGNSKDLSGVPAGTYTLTVYGSQFCEPVTSASITIQSTNGVSLDYSTQGGRSATCNESNGSITGLKTTGATTYQWVTTGTNAIVGNQLDLKDVPAGFYTLSISNGICSKSYDFEVAGFPPTVFTGISHTSTKTCDAFASGTITLNTDNANEQPIKYRWVDSQGQNVGFDKTVQFLPAGTYTVYLTDKNFCENPLPGTYTVKAYPEFKVTSFGTVTNTQCGVGIGAISATTVTGGTGNYVYQWLNADDNNSPIAGKNQATISGVLKGHYVLRITDGGCSLAEVPYTIDDEAVTPPTPSVNNIQVYGAGKATIKVNNPFATAIYRLYESATSPLPIKDTIGGDININVTESRSYYVSLTYGYCESARAEVKVFLSAISGGIPNLFTPNGDGTNDYWNIPGLDSYPSATINIFNRYGQKVYESVGYARPFDGNRNGKQLPAGVYYYIITLRRGEVLSGNVTILR